MNWKDVPHLFANGKFYAKNKHKEIFQIRGIDVSPNVKDILDNCLIGGSAYLIRDCTLIARPISDMTDEEQTKYQSLRSRVESLKSESYDPLQDTPESFMYLLSIGVLPKQFETEEVVWKSK